MTQSRQIEVKYIPDEQWAIWLFPGYGSSFRGISVWEWQPSGLFAVLDDFRVPGTDLYKDGNGDLISKEEAQEEVDYLNGKR